jgi:hypothetical protein
MLLSTTAVTCSLQKKDGEMYHISEPGINTFLADCRIRTNYLTYSGKICLKKKKLQHPDKTVLKLINLQVLYFLNPQH